MTGGAVAHFHADGMGCERQTRHDGSVIWCIFHNPRGQLATEEAGLFMACPGPDDIVAEYGPKGRKL